MPREQQSPPGLPITPEAFERAIAAWYTQRFGGDWGALTEERREDLRCYAECAIAALGVRIPRRRARRPTRRVRREG